MVNIPDNVIAAINPYVVEAINPYVLVEYIYI